ncbi:hypothetical protein [Microbulbifer taiwanensis]|uniref:Uncharacterized protein n=1 Tax=Microbulbifer taiwanensis TaxID=986746 RepID=A0ABW1YGY6_9GAMM|nr:hypothetical protein [Microbulbifer taiwanensis]
MAKSATALTVAASRENSTMRPLPAFPSRGGGVFSLEDVTELVAVLKPFWQPDA